MTQVSKGAPKGKQAMNRVMKPIDAQANPETAGLYEFLVQNSGERTFFGHQDTTTCAHSTTVDSDVLEVTGQYPAVSGFDLGRIELEWDKNIDGVPFNTIRSEMQRAWAMGSLVTTSWHSVNPITEKGYGQNLAPGSVAAVLPGGAQHEKFKLWLNRVAAFLLSVTDENGKPIPIIFRPYHEHTGDWFWWGTGSPSQPTDNSPESYARLWRFTVDYLRTTAQVHNLLYATSPDRSRIAISSPTAFEEGYLIGYPGDGYVDVMGIDDYWDLGGAREEASVDECYQNLVFTLTQVGKLAAAHGKLAAATEIGSPDEFAASSEGAAPASPWTGFLAKAAKTNGFTRSMLWYLPWRNSAEAVGTGAYGTPAAGGIYAADFKRLSEDPFFSFGAVRHM